MHLIIAILKAGVFNGQIRNSNPTDSRVTTDRQVN